ncbi:ribonuclease R [Mesomycoplasma neurolyticum]|uniref:Ribonuclease R n=1 Tax=Mesomycoplasma neurolyticum TaxID=2120 RepID=A0A449A4I9_9BACT|nr:ribonuclease R [Mesomycoplasma neurolyticum]VEU59165.1 exoribonuclease II [Mesomycoplasma neurolyticum]
MAIFNLENIQKRILNKKYKYIDLVRMLKIPKNQNFDFSKFLKSAVEKNKLFLTKDDEYFYLEKLGETVGKIKINNKGFGFVDDEDKSYFVPKKFLNNALNNDVVQISIFKEDSNDEKYMAIVDKVITRSDNFYYGYIVKNDVYFDFVSIDKKINGKFKWDKQYSLEENDVVKIKVIEATKYFYRISLVEKLGKIQDKFMDMKIAINSSEVPHSFSEKIRNYASTLPEEVSINDLKERIDLRHETIVTIDGKSTKDFDDAISIKKTQNNTFILGVHIADVSYYVNDEDIIDIEAKKRGTSIYLPHTVIPMLPFELSNGICSLNPNVDRLTITMECEIDKNGDNLWVKIYPSVINSKARLTYEEVNKYYKHGFNFEEKIINLLDNAKELSQIIRNKKNKQGYIDFAIQEPQLVLDENGNTIDILIKETGESEAMIEDFMVRANENVAEFLYKKKIPNIYRIHEAPSEEKINQLNNVLKILNINVKVKHSEKPIDFAKNINEIKKYQFDNFIKINFLRTMHKAFYSEKNIGHFGLASEFYSHFTSPIRRYPDLILHRIIREFIFNKNFEKKEYFKNILPKIAELNSASEQSAVELERNVFAIKSAEYYGKKINQEFKAQIVSIKKFGLFVELETSSSALIHVSTLPGENYEIDENELILKNAENTFRIGQYVFVLIESIDKQNGKINAILAT